MSAPVTAIPTAYNASFATIRDEKTKADFVRMLKAMNGDIDLAIAQAVETVHDLQQIKINNEKIIRKLS